MARCKALTFSLLGLAVAGCIMRSPGDHAASAGTGDTRDASGSAQYGSVDGTPLLGPTGVLTFEVHGEKEKARTANLQVKDQPFAEAVRAEILEGSSSEWSVQLQAPTVAPVERGDVMLATFYVRAAALQDAGYAETQFVFERAGAPYTKSVTYSLGVTSEWRKIQVRFVAAESYAAGQAQAIFRLGYEPQTLEFGGVTLESFGKRLALAALPTTQGIDRKYAPKPVQATLLDPVDGGELRFEVDPARVTGKISTFVYGINSQQYERVGTTVRRMGGNRQSAYNWELNASSAGSDWNHLNDAWPCEVLGYQDCDRPGAQMTNFATENRRAGIESLVTIPMLDYVSADKRGPVPEDQAAPSARYLRSQPRKTGARSLVPDLTDGVVYQDELVNLLVQKLGRADRGGVRFYSLDNEPALWPATHPRVHPKPATYAEVMRRTEATASVITELDPGAIVLGGVMFGWSEFTTLSSAPDSEAHNAQYGTYVDYFLAESQKMEQKHGRRLVHVLDIHWYPEAKGTKRITEDDASTRTIDARLAAPRSLWDPEYRERSWIVDQIDEPIRLFPRFKEKIAARYPGTELSMTEYNFGAGEHISGGLAQADVLGIFGREGLFMANYWGKGAGVGKLPKLVASAFRLYRNYDGKGGKFGDTAVTATVADHAKASIYAATDAARPGVLTVVIINKDQQAIFQGRVQIQGETRYVKAQAFAFDARSTEVGPRKSVQIAGNELRYALPPLSATMFVCSTR